LRKQISESNGNIVPLDERQIAGLKPHREEDDDDEIEGNPAAITTATRDILLKALLHTHNTKEANAELQLKAYTLATSMAEANAAITALRTKLQRMEDDAAALKRLHSTAAHMLACNKLCGFGKLQQSPPRRRLSSASAAALRLLWLMWTLWPLWPLWTLWLLRLLWPLWMRR
jgi:hypothetical protein